MTEALPTEIERNRGFTPRVIAGRSAALDSAQLGPAGRGARGRGVTAAANAGRLATPDAETATAADRLEHGRLGYRVAKRAFDVAFSLLVMGLLGWLYALVALAVRLEDGGPAIYRQRRVGKGGREFTMYKFRSMRVGAESEQASLAEFNEKDGPVFKIAEDPRVTRVGRMIRKTSIDELPQFLNVLKGDISVVGPRPALPSEVECYTAADAQRLLVDQGITCYWQTRVNRDELSFADWMELDRLYVRECSALADVKLVVQTVGVVLSAQGN